MNILDALTLEQITDVPRTPCESARNTSFHYYMFECGLTVSPEILFQDVSPTQVAVLRMQHRIHHKKHSAISPSIGYTIEVTTKEDEDHHTATIATCSHENVDMPA